MIAPTHILCPVDLSELSMRALAWAGSLAAWSGSELTVLHVVPSFEPMAVRSAAMYDPVQVVYPMTQSRSRTASGMPCGRPV
jgi:nucleotide-binding universal stress UspA family protein